MSDIHGTLDTINNQIVAKRKEIATLMRAANVLALGAGEAAPYGDIDDGDTAPGSTMRVRSDQFATEEAPAAAARAFLALRGKQRGSVKVEVIHAALVEGAFDFGSSSDSEALASLRMALAKDKKVRRLPNGTWGLWEWYPGVARDDKDEGEEAVGVEAKNGNGKVKPKKVAKTDAQTLADTLAEVLDEKT